MKIELTAELRAIPAEAQLVKGDEWVYWIAHMRSEVPEHRSGSEASLPFLKEDREKTVATFDALTHRLLAKYVLPSPA